MTDQPIQPPIAKIVPYTFERHGHSLVDDYSWLQNKDDPQVIAYLEAENAYANAILQPAESLQEQLFQELRGRIQEDDSSAPEKRQDFFYYWRIAKGQQYRVFCRKPGSTGADEQVLLDENALAQGKAYCRVWVYEPSPDNNLLAYSVDTTGSLVFDLFVKDMRSGALLAGPIPNTAWSAAWASDSRSLFYTVFDQAHRPYQLFRHSLGEAGLLHDGDDVGRRTRRDDTLVYQEVDDSFNIFVNRSRSGGYIFLTIASATTSEVRFLPADQPASELRVIEPRRHWVEYYAEHHAGPDGGRFLIRTNAGDGERAENFRLVEAIASQPGRENWRELLPHRPDVLVEEVDVFRDFLVIHERSGGLKRMRISAPDGASHLHYVSFPDPVYTFRSALNPEYGASTLRFYYSSLVTPESTVDYNVARRTWEVKKQQEIPSGYDPSQYQAGRLFATAPDGAQVPISLVCRKGLERNANNPCVLEGYGSYGFSFDPGFDSRRLSLLERGFVYAIAHVRGGSELGRAWYEGGRLMNKKNTFTDFIACAEKLVAEGYTSPDRLGIMGASAGGLLVSAVTNLRPDLFKAVVARVPFTNVITAMLDPHLPLTVIEWEQWGNPADSQAFDYMLSYSPYENVAVRAYPHILVKAGLNDLQVPYWDPAKWVARLRAKKSDSNRLLLLTNMGAGHGGASGRYDHLREDAQMFAFMIDVVGKG